MKKRCQDFTLGEPDVNGAVEIVYCTRPEDHGGEHVSANVGRGPFPKAFVELRVKGYDAPTVRARW